MLVVLHPVGSAASSCMLLSVLGLRIPITQHPVQLAAIALVARCTWVGTCCSSDFVAMACFAALWCVREYLGLEC
jgi:hypothetical protein